MELSHAIFFFGLAWGMALNAAVAWSLPEPVDRFSLWSPLVYGLCVLSAFVLFWAYPYYPLFFISLNSSIMAALIMTIRTDGEQFLILRYCSLGIILPGLLCNFLYPSEQYIGPLHITNTVTQGVYGIVLALVLFGGIKYIFRKVRDYEGLGEGDIELAMGIGAYTGPLGLYAIILVSSCTALLFVACFTGYHYLIKKRTPEISYTTPIPFGLFLAGVTLVYLYCTLLIF